MDLCRKDSAWTREIGTSFFVGLHAYPVKGTAQYFAFFSTLPRLLIDRATMASLVRVTKSKNCPGAKCRPCKFPKKFDKTDKATNSLLCVCLDLIITFVSLEYKAYTTRTSGKDIPRFRRHQGHHSIQVYTTKNTATVDDQSKELHGRKEEFFGFERSF